MLLGFPVGVAAVQCLPVLPPLWSVAVVAVVALLSARFGWWFLSSLGFGAAWALTYAIVRLSDELPPEIQKTDLVVEGVIDSIPEIRPGETRFQFDVRHVIAPGGVGVPARLRLSWYTDAVVLKAGESWRLTVSLKRPRGMMNPGGMDYELWLFTRGIRATGYVRDVPGNQLVDPERRWFGIESWRQHLHDRLLAVLGGMPFAGMLEALAIGVEQGIPSTQWEVLRRTGTTHLVAISGSHIALVAAWCFLPARWFACRILPQSIWPPGAAAITALLAALLYSALAGFAIPTQRALIMIAVVTGGILARRHLQPLLTLGVAFAIVLTVDPLAILAPGFWLSFVAVGLIWFTSANRVGPVGRWAGLWRINWATALGLAPLLLLFFGQVPLVSPLANLVAVPAIGLLVIPLALLGTLLLVWGEEPARWVFQLGERMLEWTWTVLEALASTSTVVWSPAHAPLWSVPLALGGVGLLLAPRGFPGRWLGLLLMLPILRPPTDRLAPGAFELTVLDVGQGSAAVVRTRHRTLVFDTGPRISDRFDMGAAVVLPFLRWAAVGRIDTLVVSHGDNDHSGGAGSLLRLLPVGLVYAGMPEVIPSPRVIPCHAGQAWIWDGVSFMFLSPSTSIGNRNDLSCVLQIASAGQRVLLTGDIERGTEAHLVARYGGKLKSDVLVVAHHGSNTSSTREFLSEVQPRYALISSGYLNRFGFPHPDVVARLHKAGAMILNTAEEGAIRVLLAEGPQTGHARGYRRGYRRYWMDGDLTTFTRH